MSLFPINLNLKDKRVLIVGGSRVALRKLRRVLEFSNRIEVISKDFLDEFREISKISDIKLIERAYKSGDIRGFDIVVVATNIELQREIFYESRDYRILVNSVDSIEYCDFTFSSIVKRGDLTISISTNGMAPSISKVLREYIESLIPKNIEEFLKDMKNLREDLPKGKNRMELLRKKSRDFSKKFLNR